MFLHMKKMVICGCRSTNHSRLGLRNTLYTMIMQNILCDLIGDPFRRRIQRRLHAEYAKSLVLKRIQKSVVAGERQIASEKDVVERDTGMSALPEEARGVAVGLHAVESDQLDSVVEICLFQFRIEKVVFEDHNLVELPEQRKEFFRMKVFLVRRVAVNPDQFANSLCDDLADALVEPFWINAGNFKKKRTGCGSPRSGSPEHRSDIRARRIFRSRKCRSDRWRRRA